MNRIGLGTAQWGLPYGIANSSGQPDALVVQSMLESAAIYGIDLLDTAHAYGAAEKTIGEQTSAAVQFKIVTKTLPLRGQPLTERVLASVSAAFDQSLQRLRREQIYGLLVHHADDLLAVGGELLWESLNRAKADGRAQKIGVSVYQPEQLQKIAARFPIDLVQLPLNVYDQRFLHSGLLRLLRQKNVEIHVRSVFLQGLLLLPEQQMYGYFAPFRARQSHFHSHVSAMGLTPYQACLGYCLAQPEVDRVIIGCETVDQVRMLAEACATRSPLLQQGMELFSSNDEALINPSFWPK